MNRIAILGCVLAVVGCGAGVNGTNEGTAATQQDARSSTTSSGGKKSGGTTSTADGGSTTTSATDAGTSTTDAGTSATDAGTATSYLLRTTAANPSSDPVDWESAFTIVTTPDVNLAVDETGLSAGDHTATFFVYQPGGALYQRFDVTVAVDVQPASGQLAAQPTSTGSERFWVSLPVEGTVIDTAGITGGWSATVLIDGSATPNASASFTLN